MELPQSPLLDPGPDPQDWYVDGIHQFAPWWTGEYWMVAFDGRAVTHDFSIGIKLAKENNLVFVPITFR
ncbi:MAG: hypothetical protein A2136_06905 [Chloroflexi bacterium RBG_16_54_11]|nr:MAG: hypothetical protein A2136_06905 [Chloroflexi bacterium RBG_16_54_11]